MPIKGFIKPIEEAKGTSAIYAITNKVNGFKYIGSAVNWGKRITNHQLKLRDNIHPNQYLQNAYNKYGKDAFIFDIVERCEKEKLIEREQFHIDSYDFEKLYNLRTIAQSNLGYVVSQETRDKLRNNNKNRVYKPHTEESKKKISDSLKGRPAGTNCFGVNGRLAPKTPKGYVPWNKPKQGQELHPRYLETTLKFELVKDNILYKILSLTGFCKHMKVNKSNLYKVLQDKYSQHNGYRKPKEGDIYISIMEYTPQSLLQKVA